MDRGFLDDFNDGYTGKVTLENGALLTLYHGFLIDAQGEGVTPKENDENVNPIETMMKAPSGRFDIDSKTTFIVKHGRIMNVEQK